MHHIKHKREGFTQIMKQLNTCLSYLLYIYSFGTYDIVINKELLIISISLFGKWRAVCNESCMYGSEGGFSLPAMMVRKFDPTY